MAGCKQLVLKTNSELNDNPKKWSKLSSRKIKLDKALLGVLERRDRGDRKVAAFRKQQAGSRTAGRQSPEEGTRYHLALEGSASGGPSAIFFGAILTLFLFQSSFSLYIRIYN